MNIVWRERHPETAVATKPGPHTWWHQFRLGWFTCRVVTLYDCPPVDESTVEVARFCEANLIRW